MVRGLIAKIFGVRLKRLIGSKKEKTQQGTVNAVESGSQMITTTQSPKSDVSNSKKQSLSGTRITGQGLADHAIWNGSLINQERSEHIKTMCKECGI